MTGKQYGIANNDLLSSDAARHIERCKSKLTLSLFLKRGPFWDAIAAIRTRLEITPVVSVPVWVQEDDLPMTDCRALHDTFITADARTGQSSISDWQEFFAFCVCYDPPPDQLLDFPTFSGPEPMFILSDHGISPSMTAPPIATERGQWVVRPRLETTGGDVRQAEKMIAAVRPREKRHKETDDLLAVQCAEWHDKFKLTYPRIAQRLGLRLSPDEHGKKRRSWTVQRLVKRGRIILGQE